MYYETIEEIKSHREELAEKYREAIENKSIETFDVAMEIVQHFGDVLNSVMNPIPKYILFGALIALRSYVEAIEQNKVAVETAGVFGEVIHGDTTVYEVDMEGREDDED
jgi:hypothetical protein